MEQAIKKQIKVPTSALNQRLDQFLTTETDGTSRSQIQKWIKSGAVRVNGQLVKAGYELSEDDWIEIDPQETVIVEPDYPPVEYPLDIVFEDDQIIVVNKPADMVVHPGSGHHDVTLAQALLHYTNGRLSDGSSPERPGIVHRLDKGTSGLIVCARTNAAHQHLQKQFEARTAFRVYEAITWHPYSELTGIIETYLHRHPSDPKRQAVTDDQVNGRFALSKYKVLESYPFLNRVRFKLETGRTHQIRVHSRHIGHPVFADNAYGGDERQVKSVHVHYQKFARQLLKTMDHQALHARRLEIQHPQTGEMMAFDSELPTDMADVIRKLQTRFPDFITHAE